MEKDSKREELMNDLCNGKVIFIKNEYYSSIAVKVIDGYMKYGDSVYQVTRTEFNITEDIMNMRYYMMAPEEEGYVMLVEMRGLNMEDKYQNNVTELYKEVQKNIIRYYNPNKHYTVSSLIKLGTKFFEDFPDELIDEMKEKTFIYRGTYLGNRASVYEKDDINNFIDEVLEYRESVSRMNEDNKELTEAVDSIKDNPIYEVYSRTEDEDKEPSSDDLLSVIIGFLYDDNIKRLVQFTRIDVSEYKSTHYYFYYDSNGEVNTVVRVKDVSVRREELSVDPMDKNYINDRYLNSSNDGDYIRSLFKGLDEGFIIDNWSNVSVIRNKEEINEFNVESRDLGELSSFILNNGSIKKE